MDKERAEEGLSKVYSTARDNRAEERVRKDRALRMQLALAAFDADAAVLGMAVPANAAPLGMMVSVAMVPGSQATVVHLLLLAASDWESYPLYNDGRQRTCSWEHSVLAGFV